MKTEVSISERLKDLRVEKKLNLEELAEITGISKSALGSYELDTPREMNHKTLSLWQASMRCPLIIFWDRRKTGASQTRHCRSFA